jgi:hypothetical protein
MFDGVLLGWSGTEVGFIGAGGAGGGVGGRSGWGSGIVSLLSRVLESGDPGWMGFDRLDGGGRSGVGESMVGMYWLGIWG